MWAGAMISLYWAAIAFILLTFDYINYAWPNVLSYLPPNPYDSGIGFEMASIVVFLPIYMLLSWLIRRDIEADASRKDIWVRRWALILTLFVAGATMAGDLVTLLASFFGGDELTGAFVLKVVVLFAVAAIAFMHFIADYWGYWEQYPARRRNVCWGVGVLAVAAIAAGFAMFGSPAAARQYRYDAERVGDLQSIQSETTYYYQQKRELPKTLQDLNSPVLGFTVPTDPATGQMYDYRTTGPLSFELCAAFDRESLGGQTQYAGSPSVPVTAHGGGASWEHGRGTQCFERTIDPAFYPPAKAQ